MAKVTVKLPTLGKLNRRDIVNRAFQKKLGERIVSDIKESIAVGKSPVAGEGRYEAYAADRAAATSRKQAGFEKRKSKRSELRARAKKIQNKNSLYPNSVKKKFPDKQKRPVNLSLSGKLLKALTWGGISGGVKVGLISASSKTKKIFESHNDGTNQKRNVPRRPILPTSSGQKFTAAIMARIRSLYLARVRQIIGKK